MEALFYFSLFFLPSFLVFVYKAISWSGSKNNKSFIYFLYSEYISIIIILAIFGLTLIFTSYFLKKEELNSPEKTEAFYKKFNDFKGLEDLYTQRLILEPYNLEYAYSKIYYHYRQSREVRDKEDQVVSMRDDLSVKDFFLEYKSDSSEARNSIWQFSEFFRAFFEGEHGLSYDLFYDYQLKDRPFCNFYMYLSPYTFLSEDKEAHLLKEIENDGLVQMSYIRLVDLYFIQHNYPKALSLLKSTESQSNIPLALQSDIHYVNGNYLEFIKLRYYMSYKNTTLTGLISALLILIIWFAFFYKLDVFEKEKKTVLILTLLVSGLVTELSLFFYNYFEYHLNFGLTGDTTNDLLYTVFGIGLIEESIKLIPVILIMLFWKREFNEPFDYIFFFVMSALGFSFVENLMYFEEGVVYTISGRAIFSTMAHMFFSATIAYGFVLAKFKYKKYTFPLVFGMFCISILTHGVFDFLLMHGYEILFIFFFLLMTKVLLRYINNALNNSPFFDYKIKMKTKNLRQILAIGLAIVFSFEHIYVASYYTPDYALSVWQIPYIYTTFFVFIYLADHFSHFDLVRGQWAAFSFSFNSYNLHAAEEDFVDYRIQIQPKTKGFILNQLSGEEPLEGRIVNRVSINYSSIWMKEKVAKENAWFVVLLDEPKMVDGKAVSKLLVNFASKSANLYYKTEKAYLMTIKDEEKLSSDNTKDNFILVGIVDVNRITEYE